MGRYCQTGCQMSQPTLELCHNRPCSYTPRPFPSGSSIRGARSLKSSILLKAVRAPASVPAVSNTPTALVDDQLSTVQLHSATQICSPDSDDAANTALLIELGTFGAPHGVRGELKFFALTDSPAERLTTSGVRYVSPKEGGAPRRSADTQTVEIESGRPGTMKGREVWIMKVRGIDTPEAAEALKGQRLLMHASERPALDTEDEFYVQELVGMQVILQETGLAVGTVVDVYDGTGTHDVLRLLLLDDAGGGNTQLPSTSGRTALLPFAADIVPVVDRVAKRMEITPPAGLLDLVSAASSPSSKKPFRRKAVSRA